jgi:O-antigen/teichoic acid export membrane protein
MKRHFFNAGYGVLDYISYPAGMLLVAPVVLRRMGAAEYGLWMIATAVISAGGIIASGFSDACTQRVAQLRGAGEFRPMAHTVRSMLGINVLLGSMLAAGVWLAAPLAARRVGASSLTPVTECCLALRIASIAILVRALESVAVGVQRAFERYRGTVQISTATRLLTLASAVLLAILGHRIVSILVFTVIFLLLGTIAQFWQLRHILGSIPILPGLHRQEAPILFGRGVFAWVQALGGVVFAQLDRIVLGLALGALAVTPYALCVQFAHPIYGLAASGLNFLFPYLSERASSVSMGEVQRILLKAVACNLALVVCSAGLLLLFGEPLLRIWAGAVVARGAGRILPPIVAGSALMGLSVTGTYAMQALGQFRTLAYLSLLTRAAMIPLMLSLLRHEGLQGLAASRLIYGSASLIVYLPLLRQLMFRGGEKMRASVPAIPLGAHEVSKP